METKNGIEFTFDELNAMYSYMGAIEDDIKNDIQKVSAGMKPFMEGLLESTLSAKEKIGTELKRRQKASFDFMNH